MSSEDFRLIKPVPLTSAVPFTRPSPKSVYDRTGTLIEVPANTLGVTYDPVDLRKAPWALLEPAATNAVQNNTMQGAIVGTGTLPNYWNPATNVPGLIRQVVGLGKEDGIDYIDIRVYGTVGAIAIPEYTFQFTGGLYTAAGVGETWVSSLYARIVSGLDGNLTAFEHYILAYQANGSLAEARQALYPPTTGRLRENRLVHTLTISGAGAAFVANRIDLNFKNGGNYDIDVVLRIGLPQLERDRLTSPIRTSDGAVTRAADVVGAGAGLVYSNVPITEPLWVAGTYAQGARVRDAANFVFESLADGNTSVLSEKTKWLPLGITNRLKMFDKAVNSQTVWPEEVVVVVKAAQLANALTLLNVTGASVSVSQSESTYSRARSLVSHDVLSWYDFWYQEPLWIGDVVFDDLPPYIESVVTVAVRSPSNQAAVGGFFLGKSKFIGKTQWGLTAGILSYSGATADTFGNVTLMKRDSAKKMNFEVAIPRGYEDEVYRYMRSAENVEMVAIASTNWSMTISYGYLGQWELPLSIDGKKMPVEWRGLI
jgi:hypothetical protein